jgi:hypothetical protein
LHRADFEAAMGAVAREKAGAVWTDLRPDAALRQRAEELTARKFSRADFNEKR